MTPTETQALKIIWENKGKASLLKIVQKLKISTDYSRLICKDLLKNEMIELSRGEYRITDLGKHKLAKLGIITEKAPKESKPPTGQAEKVARSKSKKPRKKTVAKKEEKKEIKETLIIKLSGLTPKLIEELKHKGFRTLEDAATTSISRLLEAIRGLELKQAADIINEARDKLRKEGKEYLWEG